MSAPLVSILIPAYNERFFGEALASARAQTYASLEIVVCDDSPGEAIERASRDANDARVRYMRNPGRLGFHGNFTRCFQAARGELIKFLNDDDRLRPRCVEALVGGMQFDARVSLSMSRRAVIDEEGRVQPDIAPTAPLARFSCMVPGTELGDFVLINSVNVIGEPSTCLFRKRDLQPEGAGLFAWGGFDYHVLADVSLWLRLLARGAAFYQAPVLSEFRMHGGQEQRGEAMDVASVVERLHLAREARAAGFLAHPALYQAALTRVRERAARILRKPETAAQYRSTLESLDQEVAAELGALPAA
jgi:glycosyltransferase involved in cell wall biosynthesis